MAMTLKVRPGLSAPLVNSIPASWDAQWFRRWITDFLNQVQIGAGVTSIVPGNGVVIAPTSGIGAVTISMQITGTANEIAVATAVGNTTLSFPQNVVIPVQSTGVSLVVNSISGNGLSVIAATGTANTLNTGAAIISGNGVNSGTVLQNSGFQTEVWQYNSGWRQALWIDTSLIIHGNGSGLTGTAASFVAGGVSLTATSANNNFGVVLGLTTSSEGYSGNFLYNPATQVLTLAGYISRLTNQGFLSGNYNTVETGQTAGCIYSIGNVYVPNSGTTNALNTLYGVGYTTSSTTAGSGATIAATFGAAFLGTGVWGFYVASAGIPRIFLDSDSGRIYATGGLQTPGYINAGPNLSATAGDITANRNNSTGVVFLGTASTYCYFNGSNYSMPSAQLQCPSFYATSDRRMKTKIKPIENALDKLAQLTGVTYEWNRRASKAMRGTKGAGLIAQDVEKVLPESVGESDSGVNKDQFVHKVLDYNGPIGLLVAAVNELREIVEELKAA